MHMKFLHLLLLSLMFNLLPHVKDFINLFFGKRSTNENYYYH